MSKEHPEPKSSAIEPRVQAHLGDQLRRYYGTMLAEPIPDRFKALLDELEQTTPPNVPSTEGRR